MASLEELILKTTKEIVVKFIETGRVSPNGFHETFRSVYRTVDSAARGGLESPSTDDDDAMQA